MHSIMELQGTITLQFHGMDKEKDWRGWHVSGNLVQKITLTPTLTLPTWNGCDHSIDNLMSIVVQSLKINGHNYSLESTFLIRNLSGRCGYAPDWTAVFVRNELSQWVLDKNKKYKMNYNFLLDPSVRCEEAVREMHESLKTMDSSLRELQMNQTSLVYEMRGSRNYIANTWIRCKIF